jgi:hypothetical protein
MPDFSAKRVLQRVIIVAAFLYVNAAYSQQDSAKAVTQKPTLSEDSAKAIKPAKPRHSPGKAVLFSAVLPGLGQAYNHKYWKIPIIYAGLGATTYFMISNWQQYNTYQSALATRTNGGIDPYANIYSTSDLVAERDYYHRYRDLAGVGVILFYVLNVVDAEVDGQLYSFDVSDDISMNIRPSLIPICSNTFSLSPGLTFALKLK